MKEKSSAEKKDNTEYLSDRILAEAINNYLNWNQRDIAVDLIIEHFKEYFQELLKEKK